MQKVRDYLDAETLAINLVRGGVERKPGPYTKRHLKRLQKIKDEETDD